MGYIYLRTNKINGKKYVGQATTKNFRIRQNNWKCLTQKYAGTAINNARKKYGLDAFDFEILKECEDEELNFWEKYYIKELNTKIPYGYNLTDGGGGTSGYIFNLTEEQKKKISEAKKGKTPWMKGKHHSYETRKKLSEALKGIKRSDETKKKLSEIRSKPVLQIDKNTNQVIAEFYSALEVQRQLGYKQSNISACYNGKRKTAGGFIWKYKEESAA